MSIHDFNFKLDWMTAVSLNEPHRVARNPYFSIHFAYGRLLPYMTAAEGGK